MSGISAKVIADSIVDETRLTTMEVVMHRFVLAEFNTHRKFSRNSASSRAIPVHKRIKEIKENPALPIVWASEQAGMSGGDELTGYDLNAAMEEWHYARDEALKCANLLVTNGLHKSLVNRILEPFMWHTVIVSSTEWQNFFDQRCDPAAQPEMRLVAEAMRDALQASTPKELAVTDYHLPYIRESDLYEYKANEIKMMSVARCARVSYLNHDGVYDPEADLRLYDKLVAGKHWSPFEHVAQVLYRKPAHYYGNFDAPFAQLRGLIQ